MAVIPQSKPAIMASTLDDMAITVLRWVIRTQSIERREQVAEAISNTIDNAMIARHAMKYPPAVAPPIREKYKSHVNCLLTPVIRQSFHNVM